MPSSRLPTARRQYSIDEKRRIVNLSLQSGANVRQVAQDHGVCSTTLVNWRKRYRGVSQDVKASVPATFLPVTVVSQNAKKRSQMHVRFEFPCGISAHIEADAFDMCDIATLFTAMQR